MITGTIICTIIIKQRVQPNFNNYSRTSEYCDGHIGSRPFVLYMEVILLQKRNKELIHNQFMHNCKIYNYIYILLCTIQSTHHYDIATVSICTGDMHAIRNVSRPQTPLTTCI
jgi:hypothetical protein